MSEKLETVTLGAGCFWCVEAIFLDLELAYKVLMTASVSCKAAGSPFALFFGCQPYMSF